MCYHSLLNVGLMSSLRIALSGWGHAHTVMITFAPGAGRHNSTHHRARQTHSFLLARICISLYLYIVYLSFDYKIQWRSEILLKFCTHDSWIEATGLSINFDAARSLGHSVLPNGGRWSFEAGVRSC